MKLRPIQWLLLLLLAGVLVGMTGCQTDDPQNESVRPWNAPQDWENAMPMMDQQHD